MNLTALPLSQLLKSLQQYMLLLFLGIISVSRAGNEDSLRQLLKQNIADTTRINTLNQLCYDKMHDNGNTEAFTYCEEALKRAKEIKYNKGMIEAYYNYCWIYNSLGKYDTSNIYIDSALIICRKNNIIFRQTSLLNMKGSNMSYLKGDSYALTCYLEAAGIAEKENRPDHMSGIYANIGVCFLSSRQFDKSKEYFKKAIEYATLAHDSANLAATYDNFGGVYIETGQMDSALYCFNQSEEIYKKLNNIRGLGFSAYYLGFAWMQMKDFDKALTYFKEATRCYEEANILSELPNIYVCQCEVYCRKKDYQSALVYGLKSLKKAEEMNSAWDIREATKVLKDVYLGLGDYKTALEYYTRYATIKDSLLNSESTMQMAEMQTKFETDKKEQENKALQEKNTIAHKTIQQQKYIGIAIGLICLLLVLFAFMVIRNNKQKQKINIELARKNFLIEKQKEEVEHQKELVEEKHKEITDSINYAERIQRSFLATKELLDENLSEYFVFFKPKDVVSGDFYWAAKLHNDQFALVTADSTGHGVPGAIMSLLNIMSLEKGIESYVRASDILNSARKTIIQRLKKDGSPEGGKDGMDASLCIFDFANRKLAVAAANNPVWIMRPDKDGMTEVIEVKPDKMPIGKHEKDMIPFSQQEFQLEKGDVVYTLTDGFPDQFGGPNGKKFMIKNLRELLRANIHLSMPEQKNLLEQTLHNWVGTLEQVDDICIIGIRI